MLKLAEFLSATLHPAPLAVIVEVLEADEISE